MFTIGVFQDVQWAERGVAALLADGFGAESLTIVAKGSPEAAALVQNRLGSAHREMQLKGIGAVLAAGPLIGVLDAPAGALAARGLAASLAKAGFQAHDGQIYETLVDRGGVLVAVQSVPRAADALARLHAYGGGNAAIGAWSGRV